MEFVALVHFCLPKYRWMLLLRNSWFLRRLSLANVSPICFSTTLSLYLSHFPHPVSVFISYKSTMHFNFCHVVYPCLNCAAWSYLTWKQWAHWKTWKCFLRSVPQHLGDVAAGKALFSYDSQRLQAWLPLRVEELWGAVACSPSQLFSKAAEF